MERFRRFFLIATIFVVSGPLGSEKVGSEKWDGCVINALRDVLYGKAYHY